MTVQNVIVKNIADGNGINKLWPFTFACPVEHPEFVKVFIKGATGSAVQTNDYTVNMQTKTVSYPVAGKVLAKGERIIIARELPLHQILNLVNQGPFFAEDLEVTYDELVMMIQQLNEQLGRSLKVGIDIDQEKEIDITIPVPTDDGNHGLRITKNGFELVNDPSSVYDETVAERKLAEVARTNAQAAANTSKSWQELSKAWAEEDKDASPSLLPADHYSSKVWAEAAELKVLPPNSVTFDKLNKELRYFVTPEMFGAVGDGKTDDTQAVKDALKYSIDNGIPLRIINAYYVTNSLLTNADYTEPININIIGNLPSRSNQYYVEKYGGIKFNIGIDLFVGLIMKGSISNVAFCPIERTNSGSIFRDCSLRSFAFKENAISDIGAFCINTDVKSVSMIENNRFLTVYYFAKITDDATKQYLFTDSVIRGNYINGGAELNDNYCFGWVYFNGSTIINNFIDYYHTIYAPKSYIAFTFQGGASIGNHYQVFRYLYVMPSNCQRASFSSVGDVFNWTDVSSLPKLASYTKRYYTGHDGQQYEIPPYIMFVDETYTSRFENAIIQSNVKNAIFVRRALTNYSYGCAYGRFFSTDSVLNGYSTLVNEADAFYNNGNYPQNKIDINCAKQLDAIPSSVSTSWSNYYIGERIRVNNTIYRLVKTYDTETVAMKLKWVEDYSI